MKIATTALLCAFSVASFASDGKDLRTSMEIAYRTLSLDGDHGKYDQHVNLHSGVRLSAVAVDWAPASDDLFLLDHFDLSASGIGGDPWQDIRLDMHKYGRHRLRYEHTVSDYVYADILIDPEDASDTASNGGDFHGFDFRRTRDKADFELRLAEPLRLLIGFDRYRRSGDSTSVLDLSREEFHLDKPVDETSRTGNIALEYRWDSAVLVFDQRWRRLDDTITFELSTPSEGSSQSGLTRLDDYLLLQQIDHNGHQSRLAFRLLPGSRWDVQAEIARLDVDMDLDAQESVDGFDFAGRRLPPTDANQGSANREVVRVDLTAGLTLTDTLRVDATVSENRMDQQGELVLDPTNDATDWQIDTRGYSLGGQWQPKPAWTLRGEWRTDRRQVRFEPIAGMTPERVHTDQDGFLLALGFKPGNGLTINLSAEHSTVDDPFVLATATERRRLKARVGYRWANGLNVTLSHAFTRRENNDSSWDTRSDQTDFHLGWASDRLLVAIGAMLSDMKVDADRIVIAGTRRQLFLIDEEAQSDYFDAMARMRLSQALNLTVSGRYYENKGTRETRRSDVLADLEWVPRDAIGLSLRYRNVDFNDDFEQFDANLVEFAIRFSY